MYKDADADLLRIFQINTSDFGGGAEGSAWNLFRSYRLLGYQSWLAVGNKFSTDADVFQIPNTLNRNPWSRFWSTTRKRDAKSNHQILSNFLVKLSYLGEIKRASERIRGIEDFNYPGTKYLLELPPKPPSILHLHNLHGDYFDLRELPNLSKITPTILNLRDSWLLTGHCAYTLDCKRWQYGCGNCPDLSIYPSIRRDATNLNWKRKADIYENSILYITAPSQWSINMAKNSMLRAREYRVIENGIDLNIFFLGDREVARQLLGLPEKAKIVLMIAHNKFKDYQTMVEALEHVHIHPITKPLIYICVGIEGVDNRLGEGNITYKGFIRDPNKMRLFYQAADIYIHAAYAEAFGKTITEAMACGIPVVATSVGGISEQIHDGLNGFLVAKNDSHQMAARINQILINPELRNHMGQSGYETVLKRYTLERQVNEFLLWYRDVIADWQAIKL